MIKILASISLLSISAAQAMDPPPIPAPEDFTENSKCLGRYPLYQEGDSGAVKGNATLFRTKDGKYFGITCAHCVPYLGSLSFIATEEKKYDNLHTVTSYSSISKIEIHPLYTNNEKNAVIEDQKYDIALFTITGNPNLKYFAGEISTEDLKEQENYTVDVMSFGPLFSKDGSSYEESVFHHLHSPLKLSNQGLLFHSFQARDFYLSFQPTQGGNFILEYGLLSSLEDANLLPGDSGSLAVTADGKAIAIASAIDKNISKLLQINQFLGDFSKVEKIDEIVKSSLLQEIKSKIANCTQCLKPTSGKETFVFKLMEGIPSIEGNDYYTPLVLHSDFINKYISNIPELNQEAQNEFKIVKVPEDSYENPEQVGVYLNTEVQLANVHALCAELKEQMSQHDLDLVNAMVWPTDADYDDLPNPMSDESSSEDE